MRKGRGACGRSGEVQRGPNLCCGLNRTALRQRAPASALRVESKAGDDPDCVAATAAEMGRCDLQGHGLCLACTSLRRSRRRDDAGSRVGLLLWTGAGTDTSR